MTLGTILLATLLLPQQPELSFGGDRIAVLPHGALGRRTVGDVPEREPVRIWRVRAYCAPQVDLGGQRAELDDEALRTIRAACDQVAQQVRRATRGVLQLEFEHRLLTQPIVRPQRDGGSGGVDLVPLRTDPLGTSGEGADSVLLFWPPGPQPLESVGLTVTAEQGPDGVPASSIAHVPLWFDEIPLAGIVLHEWAHQLEEHARARLGMPWLPGIHEGRALGYADEAAYLTDWLGWFAAAECWRNREVTRLAAAEYRFAQVAGDPWRRLPLLIPAELAERTGHGTLRLEVGSGYVFAAAPALPRATAAPHGETAFDNQLTLDREGMLRLPYADGSGRSLLLVRPEVGDLVDDRLGDRGRLLGILLAERPLPREERTADASVRGVTPLLVFACELPPGRVRREVDLLGEQAAGLLPPPPDVELTCAPEHGPPVLTRPHSRWVLRIRNHAEQPREIALEAWVPPELRCAGLPAQLTVGAGEERRLPFEFELEPDRPPGTVEYRFVARAGDRLLGEVRGRLWSAVGREALRLGFEPGSRGRRRDAPRPQIAGRQDWRVAHRRGAAGCGAGFLQIADAGGSRTGGVTLWRGDEVSFDPHTFPYLTLLVRGQPEIRFSLAVDLGTHWLTLPLPVQAEPAAATGARGGNWQRVTFNLLQALPADTSARVQAIQVGAPSPRIGNRYHGEDPAVLELDEVALVRRPEPTEADRLRDLTERYAASRDDDDVAELSAALAQIDPAQLPAQDLVDHALLERALAWRAALPKLPPQEAGFPVGRERFATMLRLQHHLDGEPEQWLESGWREVRSHQQMLQEMAGRMQPGAGWRDVVAQLRERHPTADELPAFAERAMRDALQFAVDRGIVTVPWAARDARIQVVTSGELSRTYPFGGYGGARPSPQGYTGTYFVSPPADWMDDEQAALRLRGNHEAWTRVVALHEIVPGHHLQNVVHLQRPLSPFRRSFYSTVFAEGWALYCEEAMWQAGFFTTDAERFTQLQMRLWRAVRVVVDISLHLGELTPAQAEQLLVDEAALDPVNAKAEVLRYLANPTRPMSYLIGYRILEQMVARAREREGEAFRLDRFLDSVLAFGPVPLPVVRRALEER